MKKLSMIYSLFISAGFLSILKSETPFLEIRPFSPPSFEQYPASQTVDHQFPYTNQTDGVFVRFDGKEFYDDVIYPDCISGQSCYDGHAGIDFFMPFNTPILAPASGYVVSSNFAPAADPCPGGIAPNGEQGTVILAHGNGYFTVYLHLASPLNVSVGTSVETGDTLGFAGNTGCAINTHLHFEVRKGSWNINLEQPYAVDPIGWWENTPDPIQEIRNYSSEWLWVSDTLVDDGDNGFQRFQGPDWSYQNSGFNGDCWLAPPVDGMVNSRHYAIWVPNIPEDGLYDIEIFLPQNLDATTGAIYELNIKSEDSITEKQEVVIDQSLGANNFIKIGTKQLFQGNSFAIILRDVVTENSFGNYVVFDAVRIVPSLLKTQTEEPFKNESNNKTLVFNSIFPNPFNSSLTLHYKINKSAPVIFSIFDISGKIVFQSFDNTGMNGDRAFYWNGLDNDGISVTSGIYFVSVVAGKDFFSEKIIYVK